MGELSGNCQADRSRCFFVGEVRGEDLWESRISEDAWSPCGCVGAAGVPCGRRFLRCEGHLARRLGRDLCCCPPNLASITLLVLICESVQR